MAIILQVIKEWFWGIECMILTCMNTKVQTSLRPSLLLAIVAMFSLSGCPLVSEYPLSDPRAARVDDALIGSWRTRDLDEGEWKWLSFLPFDERELVGFATGDEEDTVDSIRAFTTTIDGIRFLNVRELGVHAGSSGWYILRYAIEGDVLAMTILDDALFEGASFAGPAELYEFVRSNLSNPLLFDPKSGEEQKDIVFERVMK
jgi:hypothetical protein